MRYLVFAYDCYYPGGGMDDCVLKTNDYEEAVNFLSSLRSDYKEIYDTVNNKLVFQD